jgi:uncharacterized membrane protein (DUF485 family)
MFWDITPCSALKVNRRFGGTCRTALLATYFMLVFCLAYFSTLKMVTNCSSEKSVDFQRRTLVTSQKIELLITASVKISNHAYAFLITRACYMSPVRSGLIFHPNIKRTTNYKASHSEIYILFYFLFPFLRDINLDLQNVPVKNMVVTCNMCAEEERIHFGE